MDCYTKSDQLKTQMHKNSRIGIETYNKTLYCSIQCRNISYSNKKVKKVKTHDKDGKFIWNYPELN